MKKVKLLLVAILGVALLLTLLKMDKLKSYLPIATFVIGLLIGWLAIGKSKPEVILTNKVETVFKDTCITNNIIADVTTNTSTVSTNVIKKGKKVTDISEAAIEEVAKADSIYTTKLSKSYDYGLVKFTVTNTVKANSPATGKFTLDFQLDTLVLKEMTTVVNTVVVSKDSVDLVPDKIVQYIPTESTSRYLKAFGSIQYTDRPFYQAGITVPLKQLEFTISKNVKLKGGAINLTVPIIKIKK